MEVESPNPRAAATGVAEQLDGRRLERVEAVGKNLLLSFEGGLVLRSHLRMSGRWTVRDREASDGASKATRRVTHGRPWLVLRGSGREAVLWGGPVLELNERAVRRLGPDILARPPDLDRMVVNMRRIDQGREVGDALLDQRLVAGIGNLWKAEALWASALSPWRPLAETTDEQIRAALAEAARLMRRSVDSGREQRSIYRKVGRPCPRCRTAIQSRGQGDANRTAYWCQSCQPWKRGVRRPDA